MPKKREIGTAVLGGVVIGGGLTAILGITDISLASTFGALVGGGIAAYLLYGKVHEGALAGLLSGLFGYPFYIGSVYLLFIYGIYTPPSGPTPSMAVIQAGLAFEFLFNLGAGAVGGLVVASVRHPTETLGAPTQPAMGPGPTQSRYCVQCGAQLQPGAVICPHCGARQPQ
jgi:hypothetical protein